MKEFPFYSSFSSEIKVLVPQEFDVNLALASLDKIKEFVPDINPDEQIDLLPIAFNACVANRVNKNGDVIDTETAIRIHKNFINKPINIEHNRERVIGTILKSGFSKFGTDEPISEETAAAMKEPFNITLGGVIWKVVSPRTAKLIENSSDPTDPDYQKVSASWELGFSEYDLVVLDQDERNLSDASIVSDAEEVSKLKNYLKAEGGSGVLDNGKKVYRRVLNKVVPLGIGLTETPAADVKGIITNIPESVASFEENSSQNNKSNVTDNNKTFMKIEKISDITDEALKQTSASEVTNFIAQEIKKASDAFVAEKSATENALKESETKFGQLTSEYEQLKAQLAQVTENLNKIQAENEERTKQEVFSSRMAQFDNDFDLSPEERELITNDIASMDEDAFAAYRKKMDVLMKSKKKGMKEEKKKEMAMASASASGEVAQVVEQVVDNATVKDAGLPNTSEPSKNIVEKYKGAFSLDQFDIKV